MYVEKVRIVVVVIVNQIIMLFGVIHVYVKVGLLELNHVHFHKVNFKFFFYRNFVFLYLLLDCPITNCGTQGICVETDGIVVTNGARPIYYVCLCQEGYISAGDCNGKIIYKRNFFNLKIIFSYISFTRFNSNCYTMWS
jgi:hypothetical protein